MNRDEAIDQRLIDQGFEHERLDMSLMALYLGILILGAEDPQLAKVLRLALERKARGGERSAFISQALSGMPEAIVPFRRDPLDIFLAAGLMKEASRAGIRGEGNAVDAGYFASVSGSPIYIDTVMRADALHSELLDPLKTKTLVDGLRVWGDRPMVQIGDPDHGEVLRLQAGERSFSRMGIEPPASPPQAQRNLKCSIRLLKAGDSASEPTRQARALDVTCVAYGQALMEREVQSLVLREVQPEFLMEMHAAWLAAQEQGAGLWLNIIRARNEFLAPLPDLMQAGARSAGWWAPISDIGAAIGGSHELSAKVPRWAALRLMQRTNWAWTTDRNEWVRCAEWLQRRGWGADFGAHPADVLQPELLELPAPSPAKPSPARPSPLHRLGSLLGLKP